MIQLDKIKKTQDIEVLRTEALETINSYSKSNEYLNQIIDMQKALISKLEGEKQSALFHIEKVQLLNRKIFGRSSEKRKSDTETKVDYDFSLANEEAVQEGSREDCKQELPTETIVHKLSEEEIQGYTSGNEELEELKGQYEESIEVTIVERSFKKIVHKRQKYIYKNGTNDSSILTASMPKKLIEGGKYSTDFAIEVVVAKYMDHIPLERQVKIMQREGLDIAATTLWDQVQGVSHFLRPVHKELHSEVLSSEVLHMDETRWELLHKDPERWQLWSMSNGSSVYYTAVDTRSGAQAKDLLGNYKGVVVSDAYSGYKSANKEAGWKHAGCWSHARRKFVEIESNYPKESLEYLELVGKLFEIERKAKSYEELGELRRTESKVVTEKIRNWLNTIKALPGSSLYKAVNYTSNNWNELTLFLENAKIPLTNNAAERSLRGPVVGRKNHYGSKSARGAEAASILYSVMESCKLNKVNAVEYLKYAIPLRLNKKPANTPAQYKKRMKEKSAGVAA